MNNISAVDVLAVPVTLSVRTLLLLVRSQASWSCHWTLVRRNDDMSMSQDQFFETALSLPQPQRADLALQLLQSLDPPGEVVGEDAFAAELHGRIKAHRRGEIESVDLAKARQRLREHEAHR
jgi:putative addiction module component (TIGR02574 family)